MYRSHWISDTVESADPVAQSSDPFAFDPDEENSSADQSAANPLCLPFRSKRVSDYQLLRPVIKIPRVSAVPPYGPRDVDSESPEVDVVIANDGPGDRQSPFTPTPEPNGWPACPLSQGVSSAAAATNGPVESNKDTGAYSQDRQGPVGGAVVTSDVDPKLAWDRRRPLDAFDANGRSSSARDSAVADLSPQPAMNSFTSDTMGDAFAVLYRDGDFCF